MSSASDDDGVFRKPSLNLASRMQTLPSSPSALLTAAAHKHGIQRLELLHSSPAKKKGANKRVRELPDDVSESESDSMARFPAPVQQKPVVPANPAATAQEAEYKEIKKYQESLDPVTRIAEAHTLAAKVADTMAAEGTQSPEEVDNMASAARTLLAGEPQSNMPTVTKTGKLRGGVHPNVVSTQRVFDGANGVPAPMTIRNSYDLMHEQVQTSLRNEALASGSSSNYGSRVVSLSSALVREQNREIATEAPTPRTFMTLGNPLMDTFMRNMVTTSVDVQKSPPHLNPHFEQRVRASLTVSRRAHEQCMLREPRPDEPRCAAGDKCKGTEIQCRGGGAILVAFYFEHEWTAYQKDVQSGVPARLPDASRLCLLCQRFNAARFIVNLRAENIGMHADQESPVIASQFYNIVDVAGEYCSEDCLLPSSYVYEGFCAPIVKPNLFRFERRLDKETGTMYFVQLLAYPGDTEIVRTETVQPF